MTGFMDVHDLCEKVKNIQKFLILVLTIPFDAPIIKSDR